MTYNALRGLTAQDFEHPGEKAAMAVLRKIPFLDVVMAKYMDVGIQINMYSEACANYFRITEKTNPRVYNLYKLALSRLDMPEEYPLFCTLGYDYNAYTSGIKKPYVVLHSSIVTNLTDDEILFIIGHELGHIKCGHLLYYSLAQNLNAVLGSFGGLANGAAMGLQYAIMDWNRKAEYSADRAGMIAAGGSEGAFSGTLKLLGHSNKIRDIDFSIEKVIKQVEDFQMDTDDFIGKLIYVNYTVGASHPWSILRLKQLYDWYHSGAFNKVISYFQ